MDDYHLDLDAIEARAAFLYADTDLGEFVERPEDADLLLGKDVPALVAEVRRLRDLNGERV